MIYLIVSEVERKEFVVRKEQLGDHHSPVGLDLVTPQIEVLQTRALPQGLCQVLRSFALDLVPLDVQSQESMSPAD